jgi:histo-blood group ABO system transferase
MKNVILLIIATNKYVDFVDQLLHSVEANFLNDHQVSILFFTNQKIEKKYKNVKIVPIEHEPWPMPTLKRYNYFLSEKKYISQFDYCFYIDADMKIFDTVGEEILGDLVATQHPGQFFKFPDEFSYERRKQSTAYVPYGTGTMYYAGGFNGGRPEHFLKMSKTIVKNVEKDFQNNLIATWHDESHMNKYLINNPPTLVLTPSYCYPEDLFQEVLPSEYYPLEEKLPFVPKIMALRKSHSKFRN